MCYASYSVTGLIFSLGDCFARETRTRNDVQNIILQFSLEILPLPSNSNTMRKSLLLLTSTFLIFTSTFAQEILPVGFSDEELQQMELMKHEPPVFINQYGITTPPTSPVRNAAEWEEMQAVAITWTSYTSILKDIVKYAQQECTVYIICTDSNTVRNYLTANSVPLTNIRCEQAPYNSVWIRDYGPNTCYLNDVDQLILVDWIYNRPTRTKDDTIPSVIARDLSIPIYLTTQSPNNIVHTGGNFMSDGLGTAFSSKLILQENTSKTEAQINSVHNSFMGISRYIKMDVLPYDGIHHIDMHIKLLDEETLLVGEYPTGVSDGPQIEANLQYVLSNFNSVFGTPYKIIRIPQPPDPSNGWPNQGGNYLTYANASIVNKTVLVPQYYQQYDTTAIRIWKESMPGYKIVGINSNASISASGSLHCITHEIGAAEPLLIVHQALQNSTNCTSPYQVNARLQHKSGISNAKVWWTTDTTQPYQSVNMTNISGYNWQGFIPAQSSTAEVFYYIEATSVSGKNQKRPMPAPAAYWKFKVTCLTAQTEIFPLSINPIYPNPSKGITCIPVFSQTETEGKISLVDVLGNEVRVIHEGKIPTGEKNFFINTMDVATGTYAVRISTPNGVTVQRLIVR